MHFRAFSPAVVIVLFLAGVGRGADFYVSPGGNDAWSGRVAEGGANDGPFATLERAGAAVREMVATGLTEPVTVHLRGGIHVVARTVKLGPECSGTAAHSVTFAAYRDETPVLIGAKTVSGWQPYRDGIYRVDLAEQGLAGFRFQNLFFQGRRQIPARYPNLDPAEPFTSGWAYVGSARPPAGTVEEFGAKRVLQMRVEDVRRWANPSQGQVFICPTHEWRNHIVRIQSLSEDGRTIVLTENCSYEITPDNRYFIMGLPEEIDQPGEWALDAAGKTLYFLPPAPLADELVHIPVTRTILELDGARHVTIRGLTFQYSDGTAVVLNNSEDCLVATCTIRHVGDYNGSGVDVWGGKRNGVVGCDIQDVGQCGIQLSSGNHKTLEPGESYAENNHITCTGVFKKQGPGISISGMGNRVSRNTIHHVPRFAILIDGNHNLIEANHLHHASLETSDTGAIYVGSLSWITGHGTVIRHNFIHDVIGFGRRNNQWQSPFFGFGIYLDWTAMGVTVEGNIVARVPRAGIMVHDGRFNRIENNIIVDCGFGLYDKGSQIEASGWHSEHFFWKRGLDDFNWVANYESVADLPAWNREGSTLCDPRTTPLPDGRTMHSNTFQRNILSYDDPRADAICFRNVSLKHNPSNRNLIWHHGQPPKTGLFKAQETVGPNLIPNVGFADGELETLPPGWSARLPLAQSAVQIVTEPSRASGRAIRLRGVGSPEFEGKPSWLRQVMADSRFIPVKPGQHYRLSLWLRAEKPVTVVRIEALSFKGGTYDVRFPKGTTIGTEWEEHEVVFRFPAPGDGNYHEGMEDRFYVHVILNQDDGVVWVGDVDFREAVPMSEWDAWQSEGMDRDSVVADPLFVNPSEDDYRLRPESPAWALGFEPIPVERIGCFQDPLRASWPLRK